MSAYRVARLEEENRALKDELHSRPHAPHVGATQTLKATKVCTRRDSFTPLSSISKFLRYFFGVVIGA